MKISKFPNSKIVYSNCDISNEKSVEYYKKAIKDGVKRAENPAFSSHEKESFVEPVILFCKDEKMICTILPDDSVELFRLSQFYESVDDVVEGIKFQYDIKNAEIDYIGTLQTCDVPVFFCGSWDGGFEEDVTEIQFDEFDSVETGPMLSYLLDCRGYNYHVWFAALYHAGILVKQESEGGIDHD